MFETTKDQYCYLRLAQLSFWLRGLIQQTIHEFLT